MTRLLSWILATTLVFASLSIPVTANTPPLVDAGLDQTVDVHTTVYLDATGSTDPDGTITTYEWTITTPSGAPLTPDCRDCARTQFTPMHVGTYTVTVHATDNGGATRTDTLYVHVTPGDPPTIHVDGPTTTETDVVATYSATISAGDASLDSVRWTIDGRTTKVTNETGSHARDTLTTRFATNGVHTITAHVRDTNNQTAQSTITTRVTPTSTTASTTTGASSSGSVIHGPRVVTGHAPLTATYTLATHHSATWWLDGTPTTTSTTPRLALTAGHHDLTASVGATTARFPDGTTAITADPAPTITITNATGTSGLILNTTARDAYHNLDSFTISLDGNTIDRRTPSRARLFRDGGTGKLHVHSHYTNIPTGRHTLTLTATDGRNQTTTRTKTLVIHHPPEIISSSFTNTPVHAYDPRWSAQNYAAKHVLTVDTHGTPLKQICVEYGTASNSKITRVNSTRKRTQRPENRLRVVSYWSMPSPGSENLSVRVSECGNKDSEFQMSTLNVSKSPPVARLNVTSTGVKRPTYAWGMVVNASGSFDPDGTALRYYWTDAAHAITPNNKVGKFDSLKRGNLSLQDGNGGVTNITDQFLDYWSPAVRSVKPLNDGPVNATDSIRFRIVSERSELSKQRYRSRLHETPVFSGVAGRVVSWQSQHGVVAKGGMVNGVPRTTPAGGTNETYTGIRYVGTVSVNASELLTADSPQIGIGSKRHPHITRHTVPIPGVQIVLREKTEVTQTRIQNKSYQVESPTFDVRKTVYPKTRDLLQSRGYHISREKRSAWKYTLLKRVKTAPERWDNESKRFRQSGYRSTFLEEHPAWTVEPTTTSTQTWMTLETGWRRSRGGPGTFTGKTRQVIDQPAQYLVQHEYVHEYQKQHTRRYRVTKYRRKRIRHVAYHTKYIHLASGRTISYRVRDVQYSTRRVPFTTWRTSTYTTTERETYWDVSPDHWNDWSTGQTRRIKVRDATYRTEFQYKKKQKHTQTITWYPAAKHEMTQPAQYDWKQYSTTRSKIVARTAESTPNTRVGGRTPTTTWWLRKQRGTRTSWTSNPSENATIFATRVNATRILETPVVNSTTDHRTYIQSNQSVNLTFDGNPPTEEIKRRITDNQTTQMESGI